MTKQLTFAARDGGVFSVPASSPQTIADGTPTLLTVVPNTGMAIQHWIVNGVVTLIGATPNNITVAMNVDTHVIAVFQTAPAVVNPTPPLTHAVSGGGSISSPSSGTTYALGTNVTVTSAASFGYTLSHWLVNGEPKPVNPADPTKIVVKILGPTHVAAIFRANATSYLPYAIFSPDGSSTYTLPTPEKATWDTAIKGRDLTGKPIYSVFSKVTWSFGGKIQDLFTNAQLAYFTANRTSSGYLYFRTANDANPPQMVNCRGKVNLRPGASRFEDVWLGVSIEFILVEQIVSFE